MDLNVILGVMVAGVVVYYLLKGMAGYLYAIWKALLRSTLAFFVIWAANLIGGYFGFHMGLNLVTSLVIGVLGIPGAILLLAVKYLL